MSQGIDADNLFDAARSETKKWGGDEPSLTHLAAVLERRWPDEFVACFGGDGSERVRLMLSTAVFVGASEDVRGLLSSDGVTDADSLCKTLHDLLAPAMDSLENAPAEVDAPAELSVVPTVGVGATQSKGGWPPRTARQVERVLPREALLGRSELIERVAAVVTRRVPGVPLVIGESGSGRTALLGGLAHRLQEIASAAGTPALEVWRIGPELPGSGDGGQLARVLEDCERPVVLALDDVDLLAALDTSTPHIAWLHAVRDAIQHPLARLVLLGTPSTTVRLELHTEDLIRRLDVVPLPLLTADDIETVLTAEATVLAEHHSVTFAPGSVTRAAEPAARLERTAQPGLGVRRLDSAAALAVVQGESTVSLTGTASAGEQQRAMSAADLRDCLAARVRGQDDALDRVAGRLALTLARLDLRPERPDGVFLFVGPTGVGKTELARGLACELFGNEGNLIRLDMSEYAHDWAVSRLVGPMPGYVGSTEPETWLTTRVAAMPECVLLLDEIEKAHPQVWNTFLQVFDAGQLTDSRGVVADFSRVVVVLTSNLGAAEAAMPALGFTRGDETDLRAQRTIAVVKERMAPELVNRVDEIIVFNALSADVIEEIAAIEVERVSRRLGELGWTIEIDPAVVGYLARTGYDPAYGARHLHRNIERTLLTRIAGLAFRNVRVAIDATGDLVLSEV